jgi:hypothetical protein
VDSRFLKFDEEEQPFIKKPKYNPKLKTYQNKATDTRDDYMNALSTLQSFKQDKEHELKMLLRDT